MKNRFQVLVSLFLAVVLVLGLVPVKFLTVSADEAEPNTISAEDFAGKWVSILGDSISTYSDVSNNKGYNTTLSKNIVHYTKKGLYDGVFLKDTWWQQAIDALDMKLCVNNSWSGSCIFSKRAGTVGCYATRCEQLHNDNTGKEPDIIWIFMGTNDWSYFGDTWGSVEDVNYETLYTLEEDGSYTYAAPTTVYEAYAITLHKIQIRYPQADVYCMGLLPRNEKSYNIPQPTEVNAAMKQMIEAFGFTYVDLECLITMTDDLADFKAFMGDNRVHPNKEGMDRMTQAIVSAMLGEETTVYDIDYSLDGITSSEDNHVVLAGEPFETTLTYNTGYTISELTVEMDGEDITDSCYSDGVISIPNVTGHLSITASAGPAVPPEDVRWDYNSDSNTLVSSTADGFVENGLTVDKGKITDGVLSGVIGTLDHSVILLPTYEWIIEWKASGDWNGMMLISGTSHGSDGAVYLYRNANKLLTIGTRANDQYNNYGLYTGDLDMEGTHTYRLENRVDSNGSNMVYLVVDDIEIGAMSNYYIGSSYQGTSNWLSGTTLAFNYFGVSGFPVTDLKLEYLEVLANGTTHRHAYGDWYHDETTDVFQRACRCGATMIAAADINGATGYLTLEEALAAAAAGDTVTMWADAELETLTLKQGINLDLCGHALTVTGSVMSLTGNNIIDSTNGSGAVKCAENTAVLGANSFLPIWNGTDGYIFTTCKELKTAPTVDYEKGKAVFYFLPVMDEAVHDALKLGSTSSGVELCVTVGWAVDGVPASKTFNVPDSLIETLYDSYADGKTLAFKLSLTGVQLVDEGSLTFSVSFVGNGLQYSCGEQ